VVKPDVLDAVELGYALGLVVHDLRNPAATITANVDFLKEVGLSDVESAEALQDVKLAVGELRRGLDELAWISRWLTGQIPVEAANGDAGVFLERLERADTAVPVTVQISRGDQLHARGAQVAVEVVDLLLHNTRAHVAEPQAEIRVFQSGDWVVIEVRDAGAAIAPELRDTAFTLEGQRLLKGRTDGRYARFIGLFAASVALEGVGGSIEADAEPGTAIFRIRLRRVLPSRRPSSP
jgi:two-component system C4-dicarboxylate transport sensor histidine kinase DctB